MRKVLLLGGLVAGAMIVKSQQKDMARYLKIKQVSLGNGHPENVPAGGSQRDPTPGMGAADGTRDFDALSRGGGQA